MQILEINVSLCLSHLRGIGSIIDTIEQMNNRVWCAYGGGGGRGLIWSAANMDINECAKTNL